jgi:hypothetical protein
VVSKVTYLGTDTRYEVDIAGLERPVIVRHSGHPGHANGDAVSLSVDRQPAHAWGDEG